MNFFYFILQGLSYRACYGQQGLPGRCFPFGLKREFAWAIGQLSFVPHDVTISFGIPLSCVLLRNF